MHISKKTILFVSALGIFAGCSDDSLSEETQTSAITKKTSEKIQETEFSNFKDLSDTKLSRGFDIRPEGLSATVLRLGNVLLKSDGNLSIFPTPAYTDGKLSSESWNYQTRFAGIGRGSINALPLLGTTLLGKRIVMDHDILDVEYEHRTSGLEQFVTVKNRPLGSGELQVAFSLPDAFEYQLSPNKGSLLVSFEGKTIFEWTKLFAHDAKGRTLGSAMGIENGKLVYKIDDQDAVYPIVIDPLANVPDTTLTASGPGGEFGIAVSGAGDVNNDGFDDLIVGEFEFSNGNTEEGRALIFPGSASGISATALWVGEGGADYAKYGAAVAGIGDINNDGFDDFAIGAELAGGFQGRAFVYLGGATPSGTPVFTASAPSPSIEAFGANLTAGDYNCDGRTDLAVSAHLYDGGGAGNDWGRVLVYDGDASLQMFNSTPTQLDSPSSETFFGSELETGNFNGDSVGGNACDDLVVGQPRLTLGGAARRGRASIYFGSSSALSLTPGWSADGTSKDNRFGTGLGTGDVNNDGLDDLVVGGYHAEIGSKGTASLFLGNSNSASMSTTPVWFVEGDTDAKFGRDVDVLDTDANGFNDILVTAEKHVFSGGLTEGAVFIYFNGNGTPATTPLWTETEGGNANSNYGWQGGSAGDVNGDGRDDVYVGAFGTDSLPSSPLGHAYVYHGNKTCTIGGQVFASGDVNPGNPCQSCNPDVSETSYTAASDGTSCDDSDACTVNDVCQQGVCGGAVETCNDNNPCTDETCDSVMGCLFLTAPNNGNACADDGESCTNDVCLDGACDHPVAADSCFINNTCYPAGGSEPHSPCLQCNPSVSRTSFTAASAGDTCDDGLFCTTGDTCDAAGSCSGGARDCSALDGPCVGSTVCNENSDQCLVGSLLPVGSACNSGDLCNTGTCGAGGICNATNPVDCTNLDGPCTAGVCDPQTGVCSLVAAQDGSSCDNGDACTMNTMCQGGSCLGGAPVDCGDANGCTIDSCDSILGCMNVAAQDGTTCDDGDLCTVNAMCQNGSCGAGSPKDCSDGNECTNNTCNPLDGACVASNVQDGTLCDDGVVCTSESCQAGNCIASVNPGSCHISQMCIADGTLEPNNNCRVCDSGQSTSDYTNLPIGTSCLPTACNNTLSGTQSSDCDGNGGCVLQPVEDCGAYLCNANLDSCFTECLTLDQCELGANCTSDGVTPGICITDKPTAIVTGPGVGDCSEEIILDASGSTDPNALALTYAWTQIEGPDVLTNAVLDESILQWTLPDVMEVQTVFRFQVVVSNGAFDSDPQEWIVLGQECPTVMEPGPDMGGDMSTDASSDAGADSGSDMADSGVDASDSDLSSEVHGSGCLCSSTSKYPTDASWLLLLAFFGFRKRKKKLQ